jgi:hypothetical protein
MFRSLVAGAFVFVAAVMASAQTAPQKPGPLDNLVPTPNPANSPDQVDAQDNRQWRLAMREKYEGKFPGPAPRTPDGKPDLSGVWIAQGTPERPAMTQPRAHAVGGSLQDELEGLPVFPLSAARAGPV